MAIGQPGEIGEQTEKISDAAPERAARSEVARWPRRGARRAGMCEMAVGGDKPGAASRGSVPAEPTIRSYEQYTGTPYALDRDMSPSLGWQWLPERKGGPVFALIIRTPLLGSYKIAERFPCTEDGWAAAWRALSEQSPANAAALIELLGARAAEDRARQHAAQPSDTADLDARSLACLREVVLLGGYAPGAGMLVGERYDARFLEDNLTLCGPGRSDALVEIPYADVEAVDIGGPGLVKTGGGFTGGGFGAVGALEGMAVASVLNALTTRTSITTIIRIQAPAAEIFLLCTRLAPEPLRIELSRPLGAMRAARASAADQPLRARTISPVEELTKLAALLDNGLLTREEFDTLKAKILRS